jgi:hypothetical protein
MALGMYGDENSIAAHRGKELSEAVVVLDVREQTVDNAMNILVLDALSGV